MLNPIETAETVEIKADEEVLDEPIIKKEKKKDKKKKDKKKDKPLRGIETMFRVTATNNVRLSSMADNKAHILISINAIIISVVLGLIVSHLNENRYLLWPTIILMTVNLLTIVYAILSTKPRFSKGVFTPDQIGSRSVNLLFFGNYFNMNFKDYKCGIDEMMNDGEYLYTNLTDVIYWQGKTLGRKYKFLRIAYGIFLVGIIISVVSFFIAMLFN